MVWDWPQQRLFEDSLILHLYVQAGQTFSLEAVFSLFPDLIGRGLGLAWGSDLTAFLPKMGSGSAAAF